MRKKDTKELCVIGRSLSYETRERLKDELDEVKRLQQPHTLGGANGLIVSNFDPAMLRQLKEKQIRIERELERGIIKGTKGEKVIWERMYREDKQYLEKKLLPESLVQGEKLRGRAGRHVDSAVVDEVLRQMEDPVFKARSHRYVELGRRLYPDNPEKAIVDNLRKGAKVRLR